MPQVADASVAKYTHQTGMASSEQLEQAKAMQVASSNKGKPISLCEALVQQGVITQNQREAVEKRIAAQDKGGIQKLGNYRLIKKLGEGGMGAVYLAEDTLVGRKVAVKVLPRQHSENTTFLSRFRREARSMGKLNHTNIISAFDVGEDLGLHYYVMEYCEGNPLDKLLSEQKRLDIAKAINIVLQTARGLEHAHLQGVIHRDIKPANLFVTNENVVKILDLGLSKTLGDVDQSFNTQSGVVLGTPHYISPEQALGEKDIDGRTDIYSLGATFYHLLTGQTPFDGPNIPVILTKHLTEQLCNPQDLREDIPSNVSLVLQKMMAKRPMHRHVDCSELIRDLEALARGVTPVSKGVDATLSSIALPAAAAKGAALKGMARKTGKQDAVKPRSSPMLSPKSAVDLHRPTQQANQSTWLWAGVGAAAVFIIGLAAMMVGPKNNSNSNSAANANGKNEPAVVAAHSTPLSAPSAPSSPSTVTTQKTPPTANDTETPTFLRKENFQPGENFQQFKDRKEARKNWGNFLSFARDSRKPFRKPEPPELAERPPDSAELPREPRTDPSVGTTKTEEKNQALAQSLAAQEKSEKSSQQQIKLLGILEPLLKDNKLEEAKNTLDRSAANTEYADAADFIKQAQSDILAIRSLRADALSELRKQTGKEVTLKYAGNSVSGKLEHGDSNKVMIALNANMSTELKADKLDYETVDAYASKADAESFRRRGLMYLAAFNDELARKNFNEAANKGAAAQVKPLLEYLDARKKEVSAQEVFKKGKAAFDAKDYTKAKEACTKLLDEYKTTHTVRSQSSDIEKNLKYIEKLELKAKQSPDERLDEITAELKKINPDFDGKFRIHPNENKESRSENYSLSTENITKIAPLAVLTHATGMYLGGTHLKKTLVDISPLKGLLEIERMELPNTAVSDLTPLSAMKLRYLNLEGTCALTDLRPIQNMKTLRRLCIANSGVRDLTPLQGLNLKFISLSNPKEMCGWDALKNMESLEIIKCGEHEVSKKDFFKYLDEKLKNPKDGDEPPPDNGNGNKPDRERKPRR